MVEFDNPQLVKDLIDFFVLQDFYEQSGRENISLSEVFSFISDLSLFAYAKQSSINTNDSLQVVNSFLTVLMSQPERLNLKETKEGKYYLPIKLALKELQEELPNNVSLKSSNSFTAILRSQNIIKGNALTLRVSPSPRVKSDFGKMPHVEINLFLCKALFEKVNNNDYEELSNSQNLIDNIVSNHTYEIQSWLGCLEESLDDKQVRVQLLEVTASVSTRAFEIFQYAKKKNSLLPLSFHTFIRSEEVFVRWYIDYKQAFFPDRQKAVNYSKSPSLPLSQTKSSGVEYENQVQRYFSLLGFSIQSTSLTNDKGLDGILFDCIGNKGVIQCKRYSEQKVSAPTMRDFVGAKVLAKAEFGFFITTVGYTKEAIDVARDANIICLVSEAI